MKRPITSNEGLMNDDIDEYMATQEAGPATMSPEEKFQVVEKLAKTEMLLGQTWYLVAGDWWRRWRKACTGAVDKASPEQVEEWEIGPVDNAPLLDETDGLRTGLIEGEDVVYVPQEAWEHLVTWCVPVYLNIHRSSRVGTGKQRRHCRAKRLLEAYGRQ